MMFFVLTCVLPAFVVSVTATGAMRVLSPKMGLVDQPSARKVHQTPMALGGGIGIWLGVVVPLASVQALAWFIHRGWVPSDWIPSPLAPHLEGVLYRSGQMWAVLAGGTVLSIMGLLDDLFDLPWKPRLALQGCVAAALVAVGVRGTAFLGIPALEYVISAVWLIVLVNSFNFLDNMDGLSSGIALIASLIFAVIMLTLLSEPRWLVAGVLLVLSGSLLGFLCHNWPPARIFMGDTGSYFIGLLLASMVVLGTFYEHGGAAQHGRHVILAPLCVLAVPLYDFVSVLVIRLLEGRSPFQPDKSHFSHRLVELGLPPKYAVMTVHLATVTTGLAALLLYRVSDWSGAWLVIALVLCVLTIVAILETVGRRDAPRVSATSNSSTVAVEESAKDAPGV
jgi:UDP-GlcNAc:undecaprenyl-phosphate GlcNAc-1-phosphate transferase